MSNPLKILMLLLAFPLNCSNSGQMDGKGPFEYRDVHLPPLSDQETRELNLNSVDRDWGIWGHNLAVVLPSNPAPSVYARSGNSVNTSQFCFSSDALFRYIKEYIDDYYGSDVPMRFAILPNDNQVVCQCQQCVEHGNTAQDASGAVYYMLERLTAAYPRHQFFSSYYRTTTSLPDKPLPDNAGVLISAMSYPLSPVHTPQEDEFEALLRQWSKYTRRLYVWDYINNFDDYLTPVPIFDIAQRRLRMYADAGVKGVFLNGSGAEYSTMSRIKTHVLAALLRDPDTDWRELLEEKCNILYPVTGQMISDFMVFQEDLLTESGKSIPLYEGVPVESRIYLPAQEFIRFHDELNEILPMIKDPEYTEIRLMCRAMMFTRLELNRMAGDTVGCGRLLAGLERAIPQGLVAYSESGGSTASYISEYRYMLSHAAGAGRRDLLKGVTLEPLTALDEEYDDISILTDGLLGLPSSYHCGQMLSSASPSLRIAIPRVRGLRRLCVSMTRNAIYHIGLPASVSLTLDGRDLGRRVPRTEAGNPNRSVVEFTIPSGSDGTLVLTLVRNPEERTMAIDEIEGFRR